MARQAASSQKQRAKNSEPAQGKKRAASPAEKQARRVGAQAVDEETHVFDERTRRDIAGVIFAVLAVALFVVAVMPSDAVVTSFVGTWLHLALGIGAYILPFLLIIIGATFLARTVRGHFSLRMTVGLLIIFIALLTLFALFTPEGIGSQSTWLFDQDTLVARGGYVGAGIAWLFLTLLGQVVSVIIMIGLIVVGLVVIGFSITGIIERVQDARERREEEEDEDDVQPAPPYARIRRADGKGNTPVIPPESHGFEQAPTNILPKEDERKHKPTRRRPATNSETQVMPQVGEQGAAPHASETQMLTRKLGRRHENGDKASSPDKKADPKALSAAATVALTSPSPADGFQLPPMSLLKTSRTNKKDQANSNELSQTAACLQETLEDFGIMAEVVGWVAGPTVTLFKVDLPAGVRVSRITALEDDIALALAAPGVRIFAPIPGTNYVGIEVPNHTRQNVLLGDVLKDAGPGPLQVAIGKDVEGHSIISDLAKMPHLLIGGTTGSGKSVAINAMIMSILMRATPAEVRFIMIDPKRVEFSLYNGIPHLYVPVVTEPREAASALSWGVAEMERRLKVFSKAGVRNIGQYNAKVKEVRSAQSNAEATDDKDEKSEFSEELPYIVIVIDELSDLMMNVGKEVEFSISRIAQLARAAGIHLIVATQRPSTNVVTGLIKANITNRIAFNVASGIDSRVILDTPGAENLIGLGDLLFSKPEYAKPQRIQGCYVSEEEINSVVNLLKEQGEPEYHSEILQTNLVTLGSSQPDGSGGSSTSDDPLLWEAADIIVSSGLGSTSGIQRRLKVGYSRAGRIMDMLEEKGVVGPPNGSKPREVLVDAMELETLKAFEEQDV